MPISDIQNEILRLLAANRSPESYLAGATVLHRSESSPRYSQDLDFFHDIEDSVAQSAELDAATLLVHGHELQWRMRPPPSIGPLLPLKIDYTRGTMQTEMTPFEILKDLLAGQQLAAVATQLQDGPYSSLVAFSASDDLRTIAFVTSRATTKFQNVSANPNVSVLIDNRTHSVEDFSKGTAVTAIGKATERTGNDADKIAKRFIQKHPHLEAFVKLPTTAILQICVETYYIVTSFQHVIREDVTQW